MDLINKIACWLVIIGAIAWGLAAFGLYPIDNFGDSIAKIIYILVGLSGVLTLIKKCQGNCQGKC